MKAIRFKGQIGSVTRKQDNSCRFSTYTPAFSVMETAELMELQHINLDIFFKPLDTTPDDILTIDKDFSPKTSSHRLRDVLYVLWKQLGEKGDFNSYYQGMMDKVINHFKEKLEG